MWTLYAVLTFAQACQGTACMSFDERMSVATYASEFECLKAAQEMPLPPQYIRGHVTYECGERKPHAK